MTQNEITSYLLNDLKVSVNNDVYPTIHPNNPEGGYFAVPRLVLSYVDYLGALYHGYTEEQLQAEEEFLLIHNMLKHF